MEAVAQAETKTPGEVFWLPLVFLGLLVLVPIADTGAMVTGFVPPGRRFQDLPFELKKADFVHGTVGNRIENFFQARSVLYHGTGAVYNEGMYFFRGVPGVEFRGDWLFLESNLVELEKETVERAIGENIRFVREAQELCRARGAELLLVTIPDRTRVYSRKAFPRGVPEQRNRFLPAQVTALHEAGIPVLDLTEPLRGEVGSGRDTHFVEDHHWTYHGSAVAAKEVARWLGHRGDFQPREPSREFRVQAEREPGSPNRSLVTLLKFRKSSPLESKFLREQELVNIDPDWQGMEPGSEPGSALVLESSFGMFGFSQFLEMELRTRIDAMVEPGNGSVFAMARYLSDPVTGADRYPCVVWVVPEYHLLEGLVNQGAGWRVDLPKAFEDQTLGQAIKPSSVFETGFEKVARRRIVESASPRIRVGFAEPVSGIRLTFRCVGGAKRGQILCPPSNDHGLLILPRTEGPVHYDIRLREEAETVDLALEFPELGYVVRDWEIQGIPARSLALLPQP